MLKRVTDLEAAVAKDVVHWQANPGRPDWIVAHERFGILTHAVACNSAGRELYDLPLCWERPGAICVTLDEHGNFVLLRQFRLAAMAPSSVMPYPNVDPSNCGAVSLECPRGFPEPNEAPELTALREVEEETGFRVVRAQFLGWSNPNTSMFPYPHRVWEVRIDSTQKSERDADPNERIDRVIHYSWGEVLKAIRSGEIFCGMTKAAILDWHAFTTLKNV